MLCALIEKMLYESGYLLDLYLADASQLPGLMIVTIILWLLIGCVIAAISQR
jgi:hypothetical protein